MRQAGEFLLLIGLLAGVWWTVRTSEPLGARWVDDNEAVLRRILNVAPEVGLEFKETRAAEEPGSILVVLEIVREGERKEFELPVSQDGRRVHYDARTLDLGDPFRSIQSDISLQDVPALGSEGAPLTIVEYSDFTCQYSHQFFETIEPELFARYGSRVRLLYKQAPLGEARPGSEEAAVAAACAFRQGNEEFWAYHARLFAQASRLGAGNSVLLELAREAALNLLDFENCLAERLGQADVTRDVEEADRLGVDATPTFFFNGRPIDGLPTCDYFFHIVEEELAAARH